MRKIKYFMQAALALLLGGCATTSPENAYTSKYYEIVYAPPGGPRNVFYATDYYDYSVGLKFRDLRTGESWILSDSYTIHERHTTDHE